MKRLLIPMVNVKCFALLENILLKEVFVTYIIDIIDYEIYIFCLGGGCLYEGKVYQQGQTWTVPCKYNCVCKDGTAGRYSCTEVYVEHSPVLNDHSILYKYF